MTFDPFVSIIMFVYVYVPFRQLEDKVKHHLIYWPVVLVLQIYSRLFSNALMSALFKYQTKVPKE